MEVKLYSDLSTDDCTAILSKKLKGYFDCDEYCGKVVGNKFWIRRQSLNNAGIRYGPPRFTGNIVQYKNGSIIEGCYRNETFVRVLEYASLVWVTIFGTAFFLAAFFGLLFKASFLNPGGIETNFIVLFISPLFIILIFAFTKYCRRLRAEDRKCIKEFLMTNLCAREDEKAAAQHRLTTG